MTQTFGRSIRYFGHASRARPNIPGVTAPVEENQPTTLRGTHGRVNGDYMQALLSKWCNTQSFTYYMVQT